MKTAGLQLEVLSRRLRAAEERWRPQGRDLATDKVEAAAGPLHRRRLHEWLGVNEGAAEFSGESRPRMWTPAVALFMDAVMRTWRDCGGLVVWIGRAVWPYAASLSGEVAADSVLIHPAPRERLWAIDLALRSHAVTAVVADGSGLSLRATRRLQLAAEAGRSLAMLARPGHEAAQRSAAAYRWVVRTAPVEAGEEVPRRLVRPRWEVELIRSKDAAIGQGGLGDAGGATGGASGSACGGGGGVTWSRQSTRRVVEWRHEGLVVVPAVVGDRTDQAVAQVRRGA